MGPALSMPRHAANRRHTRLSRHAVEAARVEFSDIDRGQRMAKVLGDAAAPS